MDVSQLQEQILSLSDEDLHTIISQFRQHSKLQVLDFHYSHLLTPQKESSFRLEVFFSIKEKGFGSFEVFPWKHEELPSPKEKLQMLLLSLETYHASALKRGFNTSFHQNRLEFYQGLIDGLFEDNL